MDELGIKALTGEKGYTVLEKTGIRPCLDVNGIWGGYIGDGRKTVLPSKAHAKISMRLTAYQDHHKAAQQLMGHLQNLTPDTMKIEIKDLGGGPYALTSVESKAYAAAEKAFLQVWNKNPVPVYSGGSIPIVSVLNENLKADVVLMGFGLESDAIHSPNEHFVISHIPKGIATIIAFHKFFATPE
jgi:acetylornithine deacetylase/succinyl-diaminopimelate desuccinylase-like protein